MTTRLSPYQLRWINKTKDATFRSDCAKCLPGGWRKPVFRFELTIFLQLQTQWRG